MADTVPLGFEFDARFDKLFKAMATMEARMTGATNKFNTQFQKANKKVVDGLTAQATGFARLGNVTNAQRFVIQNTANQFGDMAVQIGAGTSVMRVMGLQLPQLFGGFAALGGTVGTLAPLLGTIAAIGLPLAAVFFNMASGAEEAADKADTLEKKVELLATATRAYAEAAELALLTTDQLKEKYGGAADEAQRALDIQLELRRIAGEAALTGAISKIGTEFGGLDLDTGIEASGTAYEDALDRIRDKLKLTGGDAVVVAQALQAALSAEGPEQQIVAFENLRAVVIEIYGGIAEADKATGGWVTTITNAVLEAASLRKTTEDVAHLAGVLAGLLETGSAAIDGMNSGAIALAQNIAAAAKAAWDYAGALGAAEQRDAAGNLTQFGPGSSARSRPKAAPNDPDFGLPKIRKGGGGGGASNINREEAADLARVKSLYEATRTSAEKYAEKLDELNRLRREGKIDNDLYARSLAEIDKEFRASNMDQFRDSILDIASGVTSASDAFDALKDAIKRAAIEFLFFGTGPLSGGGGIGSILGNIIGSAFGGAKSFDGGGYTGAGVRAGGIDGKGGYMAMVHPRESVVDHTKGGAAGGAIDMRIAVDNDGNMRAFVEKVSSGVAVRVTQANNRSQYERQRRS